MRTAIWLLPVPSSVIRTAPMDSMEVRRSTWRARSGRAAAAWAKPTSTAQWWTFTGRDKAGQATAAQSSTAKSRCESSRRVRPRGTRRVTNRIRS
ncbi:hypothetical protein ABT063_43415 [Streptomyces sp. NPDC002838]|uniref:hypothetical protein n=1 Tax=Streptomyces sp. NPDC002838 TaxID=3154436 RepID=UPI00332052F4